MNARYRAWHTKAKKMFSPEEMAKDQMALLPDGSGFWNRSSNYASMSVNIKAMIPLQSTGLTAEKEVFAGDKLAFTVFDCFDNDTQYEGYVVWSGSRFMLWNKPDDEFYGDDGGFDLDWVLNQDYEAKVIGNIYENPPPTPRTNSTVAEHIDDWARELKEDQDEEKAKGI